MTEHVYRYLEPSRLALDGDDADLMLASSGGWDPSGAVDHPRFFDGFLEHAEQMATALLVVARVARTRFYVPPGMLAAVLRAADPVVTSNGDRLRFESFSACAGVYARLDALPGSLGGPALSTGTTNVDVNPPLREALARVGGGHSLHLSVGRDVTFTTAQASVTEEKVPLPDRWLKGFAEVQASGAGMVPVLEVPIAEARRFLRALPRSTGGRSTPLFAVAAGRGLRLTGSPGRDAVCVAGPERLRVLEPLLRFGTRLRAYAPAGVEPGRPTASLWELTMDDARMAITLSPELSRGFSGEGGVLRTLADPLAGPDADVVAAVLSFESRIDVLELAKSTALGPERVIRALGRLAAAGRVGYDAAEGAYFHRELPYDPNLLDAMHPRLSDARALVAGGAVRTEGDRFLVRSGDLEYTVRATATGHRCTCPWYGKHRDDRGPCKHVLAVELVAHG